MAPPDAKTIRAAVDGDEAALAQVLGYLYPLVARFIAFRFGSLRSAVEDATQDCMIEIIGSLRHYRGTGSLKSWALRLTFRTARRLRERNERHEGPAPEDLPESVFAVAAEDRAAAMDLLSALSTISDKKRDALVLTEVLGLTAKEAAEVLGTFENTVRSRARHAKAELEAQLGDPEVSDAS